MMIMYRSKTVLFAVVVATLFFFGKFDAAQTGVSTAAAEMAAPDATFTIDSEQTSGAATYTGSGTITFKGESHPFMIEGMNVQGVDSNHPVQGEIYGAKQLDDILGHYDLIKHGTESGVDVIHLKNAKGVKAVVKGANKNVVFGLKASGVTVSMGQ